MITLKLQNLLSIVLLIVIALVAYYLTTYQSPMATPQPDVRPESSLSLLNQLDPTETAVPVFLTAYTHYDNDPPGSAAISHPILHSLAGGVGTYTDPITLAVGFTDAGPDIEPGTKYYVPHLQRYVIVEDICAACHPGYEGLTWVDIWIDGVEMTAADSDLCARSVTRKTTIIKNPKPTYPVTAGVIATDVCAQALPE